MNTPTRKPQAHLINILQSTRAHHPNFALFLGAGASLTSGVKTSRQMIKDWRCKYFEMYGKPGDNGDEFLRRQHWFETAEEYSVLFEALYDQPSQRREFIESCVSGARPSWGYIYLVNLIAQGVFNTVFTTNFDDLLNEACYLFSSKLRPIVCAHDSSIRSVRITSKRPKIIKLHGDFLFDNIKNTLSEVESLENNMKEKFKQYATEFGLIVVGYSGSDRSIMDTLNTLLRQDNNFPHGVYWCVREGSTLSRHTDVLTRYPKFHVVEIGGFDEFFADVHEALGLALQPEMSDPYRALAERLNCLMDDVNLPEKRYTHKVIERDIQAIGQKIAIKTGDQPVTLDATTTTSYAVKLGEHVVQMPLPYGLLAQIERRLGHFENAMTYILRELDRAPSIRLFADAFALLCESRLFDFEPELLKRFESNSSLISQFADRTFDIALPLITAGRYDAAEKILDAGYLAFRRKNHPGYTEEFYFLNRLQIKAHRKLDFNSDDLAKLKEIETSSNVASRWGAKVLLKDFVGAEIALAEAVKSGIVDIKAAQNWPIYRLIPETTNNIDIQRKTEEVTSSKILTPPSDCGGSTSVAGNGNNLSGKMSGTSDN